MRATTILSAFNACLVEALAAQDRANLARAMNNVERADAEQEIADHRNRQEAIFYNALETICDRADRAGVGYQFEA